MQGVEGDYLAAAEQEEELAEVHTDPDIQKRRQNRPHHKSLHPAIHKPAILQTHKETLQVTPKQQVKYYNSPPPLTNQHHVLQ